MVHSINQRTLLAGAVKHEVVVSLLVDTHFPPIGRFLRTICKIARKSKKSYWVIAGSLFIPDMLLLRHDFDMIAAAKGCSGYVLHACAGLMSTSMYVHNATS